MPNEKQIVRIIRKCIKGDCPKKCPYYESHDLECRDALLKDAANAIERHDGIMKPILGWISVKDKMPKPMQTVFVTNGTDVGFSFTVNDYGKLDFYSPWNITHWMPLPEPPKEE